MLIVAMQKEELVALFRQAFKSGLLRRVPKNPTDAQAVLALSIAALDTNVFYDEAEIDIHLKGWLQGVAEAGSDADHVTWRRALVDYRFVRRATDGEVYRLEPQRIEDAIDADARDVDPLEIRVAVEAAKIERQARFSDHIQR